ncbi:rod shape-determining protein MreC [Clostridium sp. SHJSY1]|uniref:rod shape-determining protein MreC n=1 Tax=Clostridium sp. SHJSY1 TaxID=2942483 RepID=UPI0028752CDC|nr:rod shape-determining protein MreC [Clostridium sp. SHJSY1]MDS0528013.1 rod shape-determining protein MreC [Clostridium sp. SHJSY1]
MKLFKNKLTVTVIVLSVAFLGLIIYTANKDTSGVQGAAGTALNPIQKIAYNINRGVKNSVDFFLNFSQVKEENKELTKENEDLKSQLLEYSHLKEENDNFRSILDFKEQHNNYNYIATNIISYSGGGIIDGYTVDKGQNDGIEKNMIVISPKGLVGQVSKVGPNWAIIQGIINENINVAVKVDNTNDNGGILKGYKDGSNNYLAKISDLLPESQVKEGDTIVTSGLGGLYPKGIKVGTVASVEENKSKVMKNAIVKPSVDFGKIDELYIVAPKDKRDIKYD